MEPTKSLKSKPKTYCTSCIYTLRGQHVQSVTCLVLKYGLHLPGREGAQSPWFLDPVGSTISRNTQSLPGYTWRVGQLIQVYNCIKGLFRYLDNGGGNKYWENIHISPCLFPISCKRMGRFNKYIIRLILLHDISDAQNNRK